MTLLLCVKCGAIALHSSEDCPHSASEAAVLLAKSRPAPPKPASRPAAIAPSRPPNGSLPASIEPQQPARGSLPERPTRHLTAGESAVLHRALVASSTLIHDGEENSTIPPDDGSVPPLMAAPGACRSCDRRRELLKDAKRRARAKKETA